MRKLSAASKKRIMENAKRLTSAAFRSRDDNRFPATRAAAKQGECLAYKFALPGLGSSTEIREYVQHVAQGIALGFFTGREGSQLLYAAQVAQSLLKK